MKKKRFTEEQIIGILKEAEAGVSTADLCRKHGMSSASFYAWRSRYGGMEVSDAKRLKDLEDENRRLKTMVADLSLDNQMLRAVNSKNGEPCGKAHGREMAHGAVPRRVPQPTLVRVATLRESLNRGLARRLQQCQTSQFLGHPGPSKVRSISNNQPVQHRPASRVLEIGGQVTRTSPVPPKSKT